MNLYCSKKRARLLTKIAAQLMIFPANERRCREPERATGANEKHAAVLLTLSWTKYSHSHHAGRNAAIIQNKTRAKEDKLKIRVIFRNITLGTTPRRVFLSGP